MQLILVEADKKARDIFSLNLGSALDIDVVTRENGVETCAFIDLLDEELIIVTSAKVDKENTAERIITHINETPQDHPLHIFVLGDFESSDDRVVVVPESIGAKKLAAEVNSRLNASASSEPVKEEVPNCEDYFGIPIGMFHYTAQAPCDVSIKVKKDSGVEYVKRFSKGDGYEQSEISQYETKGATHLYIPVGEKKEIVEFLNKRFFQIISGNLGDNATKDDIQTHALNQLAECGMSASAARLASETVGAIMDKIDSNPKVTDLLKDIYKTPGSFQYRNSYMISVLGSAALKKMDWSDKKIHEHMAMAAFLHDMELPEESLQQILSQRELNGAFFSPDENKKIEKHALTAAEKLEKNQDIPSEVTKIVKQHHGVFSGVGFSNHVSSQITPVAKVFIASEELSNRILLTTRQKLNVKGLIEEIRKKYEDGSLDKALDGLKEVFS